METRRIIMTSTFYPPFHLGGDAVHVRYLAEELARRGHEVHVLHSLDAFSLKARGVHPELTSTDVMTHPVGTALGPLSATLTYLTGYSRAAVRELQRLVAEVRPDWVHHHNISLLGQGMLSVGPAPSLLTSHDHWLACPRSDLSYLGRERCEVAECNYCSLRSGRPPQLWRSQRFADRIGKVDVIISPSAYMADFLRERLSLRSTVLPNFVPPPGAAGGGPREHFVFAGVLEPHKGLDLLLRGYQECGVRSELHVLGRGSLEPMVREAERRTGGRIKALGFLERKAVLEELSGAIALVAPSNCLENSPLSCIEALSVGAPLIVSPLGGLPELVANGAGMVADSTPESIGSAMRMLERQGSVVSLLSAKALEGYRERHSPERYISSYLELAGGAS